MTTATNPRKDRDVTVQNIDYNATDALKAVVVGHRITSREEVQEGGLASIRFTLDNGVILEAREAEGGCACSNGCWSVQSDGPLPESVITDVEVVDEPDKYGGESATLRMFVFSADQRFELVTSEGGDNGYYGWGYHVFVHRAETPTGD